MKQLGKVFEDIKNRRTKSINDEDLLVVRGLERHLLGVLFAIQIGLSHQLSPMYRRLPVIKSLLKKTSSTKINAVDALPLFKNHPLSKFAELKKSELIFFSSEIQTTVFQEVRAKHPHLAMLLFNDLLANGKADDLLSAAQNRDFILENCTAETVLHASNIGESTQAKILEWYLIRPAILSTETAQPVKWMYLFLISNGREPTLAQQPLLLMPESSLTALVNNFKSKPEIQRKICLLICRTLRLSQDPIPPFVETIIEKSVRLHRDATIENSGTSKDLEKLKANYKWMKSQMIKEGIKPTIFDFIPFLPAMPETERRQIKTAIMDLNLSALVNSIAITRSLTAIDILSIPPKNLHPTLQDLVATIQKNDQRAACRCLKHAANATDAQLLALFGVFFGQPELQFRVAKMLQSRALQMFLISTINSGSNKLLRVTQQNFGLKVIKSQITAKPKNIWLRLIEIRSCVQLKTKWGKSKFFEGIRAFLELELNPKDLSQLFLICIDAREKESAIGLANLLIERDDDPKIKLWTYNKLQILGTLPEDLIEKLFIERKCTEFEPDEAVIIDPGYSYQAGHHENSNLATHEILQNAGCQSIRLVCSENTQPSGEVLSTMTVTKALFSNPYAHNGREWSVQDLHCMNDAFYQDINFALKSAPAVIYFHSMRVSMILGFAKWVAKQRLQKELKIIIGVIEFDFLNKPQISKAGEETLKAALDILSEKENLDLIIYGETDTGVSLLKRYAKDRAFKVPYLAALATSIKNIRTKNNLSPPKKFMHCGFLGGTRADKGLDALIDLLSGTGEIAGIKWTIQYDPKILEHIDGNTFTKIKKLAKTRPDITFQTKTLTKRQYEHLFGSIDLVVLPYTKRYQSSGSGILFEALARGIPLLISPLQNLTSEIKASGGTYKTFDFNDGDKFSAILHSFKPITKKPVTWSVSKKLLDFVSTNEIGEKKARVE